MTYDAEFRGRSKSKGKIKEEANHQVAYIIANTVESPTIKEIVQLLARSAKIVERTITLRLSVKVINMTPVPVDISQRKEMAKDFMR